jgi:hypothetical protein
LPHRRTVTVDLKRKGRRRDRSERQTGKGEFRVSKIKFEKQKRSHETGAVFPYQNTFGEQTQSSQTHWHWH